MKSLDPILVATFGLCLSLWFLCMLLWVYRRARKAERVRARLQTTGPGQNVASASPLWEGPGPGDDGTTARSFSRRLEAMFRAAGWEITAGPVLGALFVLVLFSGVFSYVLLKNPVLSLGVGTLVLAAFYLYLRASIRKYEVRFESQFADALQLAVRSLRAGLPMVGTLRLVADEMGPPVGRLFGEICQQHNLGISIEEALHKTARHSTSRDLQLFATSVSIHTSTGGNLADMMERLALVIRERMKLARRVRVLSSQTQFSKRILLGLPFILFLVLQLLNPKYVQPFYDTGTGRMMIGISVGLLALGAVVMNRLATLDH